MALWLTSLFPGQRLRQRRPYRHGRFSSERHRLGRHDVLLFEEQGSLRGCLARGESSFEGVPLLLFTLVIVYLLPFAHSHRGPSLSSARTPTRNSTVPLSQQRISFPAGSLPRRSPAGCTRVRRYPSLPSLSFYALTCFPIPLQTVIEAAEGIDEVAAGVPQESYLPSGTHASTVPAGYAVGGRPMGGPAVPPKTGATSGQMVFDAEEHGLRK